MGNQGIRELTPSDFVDWDGFLLENGDEEFFHSLAWLQVLRATYAYQPVYFGALQDNRLMALIPLMEVNSWVTGKRGVSLPFSDQCPPFHRDKSILEAARVAAVRCGETRGWDYIEWRDPSYRTAGGSPSGDYYTHLINLDRPDNEILRSLDTNNQRNIRKAGKAPLSIEFDCHFESLRSFYRLHSQTRRRHGVPPQPFKFFKNLHRYVLETGFGQIVIARHEGEAIAASVFVHFGKRAIFKFGASSLRFQSLRPNNLIMWEAIKWYASHGYRSLSLGRTDKDNPGLLHFKRQWGAREDELPYFRYNLRSGSSEKKMRSSSGIFPALFKRSPEWLLKCIGALAYKHIG